MTKCFRIIVLFCCAISHVQGSAKSGAPIKVDQAKKQPIYQPIPLTGTVTSARVSRISVAVGGLVAAINVEEGSRVHQGDVLLTLDSDLADLQTKSAAARTEQLRDAWNDAKRRLQEARSLKANIAESTVRDLQAEVSEDQALLREAQADYQYQQAVLARHKIIAPFTGVISSKLTELGEWVVPGQGVLELVALDTVRIDFKVAEDYLAKIGPAARISYTLNAYPQQRYEAAVGTIVPVSDPRARTFLLRVPIDNIDRALIPGLSVSAQMKVPTGRKAIVVSRDATLRTPDGRIVVWTLDEMDGDLRVRENKVTTGLAFDGLIEISSGLTEGAQVVVQGNEALQDGQRVYIAHD